MPHSFDYQPGSETSPHGLFYLGVGAEEKAARWGEERRK